MKPDNIEVITSPDQVGTLLDPTGSGDAEFSQTLKQIEDDKKRKLEEQAQEVERLKEKNKPKPTPLKLEYKYSGTCSSCVSEVKTIMVDNEAGCFAVAFCLTCNIQLESKKVDRLDQPKKIILPTVPPIKDEDLKPRNNFK